MAHHWEISIQGRVQGVWYRKYAYQKAAELGLRGFVQNQSDGSVYAELEGELPALEAMKIWCWQGSPLSHVSAVEVRQGELKGFSDMEIRI